jgi:hypothetical protein
MSIVNFGNNILAGTWGHGVYISGDEGINWSPFNYALPAGYISQLYIYNDIVFCSATTISGSIGGVYYCDTSNFSWRSLSDNLSNTDVQSIIVSGNNLVIGTNHSGIFYRNISSITSIADNSENILPVVHLLQNYPNPFNPNTKIKYSLAKTSDVKITVLNGLGQIVTRLVNAQQIPAGNYEINFNADHLATGIYFYNIQTGDFAQTKKMVLLK